MNSLNRDGEEARIELLKKDFVVWRKKWLEEWSINGCPGGENKPDNHYLLFNWFEKKLEEAKASERKRCLKALPKKRKGKDCHCMYTEGCGCSVKDFNEAMDQAISAIIGKEVK